MVYGDMRYWRNQRRDRQSGFNLIELALALAVVGLVGAGIWGATSSAYDSRRVNETVDQVQQIVDNIRDRYATASQLPNESYNFFTQTIGGADLFPAEARLSPTSFANPWSSDGAGSICGNGTICISAIDVFGGLTPRASIILMLRQVPGKACINVTNRLLNIAPEIGLAAIGTDPADNAVPTNVLAVNANAETAPDIDWLTTNCDTDNPNNLYLGFRLAP